MRCVSLCLLIGAHSAVTRAPSAPSVGFAGVRLSPPLSTALAAMGVLEPTPIQAAAIAPLTAGASCILHAETGSGKTLAYLLPLLKRMLCSGQTIDPTPFQALIIVPTKELAVQVAADISVFTAELQTTLPFELVSLCISTTRRTSSSDLRSPIVVATPFKLLDIAKDPSFSSVVGAIQYIVVDEVDRLLGVPGRYASNLQLKASRTEENPTVELLQRIVAARGGLDQAGIQVRDT